MLTFLLFVALPIFGIFIYLKYKSIGKRIAQLAKEGVESDAKVEKLREIGNARENNRHSHYLVDYGYDVDGKHFSNCVEVSKTEFEKLTEGGNIKIAYLKSNPSVSHPNYMVEIVRKAS